MKDLKDISQQQIWTMPILVQIVYFHAYSGQPLSFNIYEKALNQHPEYFEEEIKRRKVYDSIPQEVHDAYIKEKSELWIKSLSPQSKVSWLEILRSGKLIPVDTEQQQREKDKREQQEIELFNKHYGIYNLKYQ